MRRCLVLLVVLATISVACELVTKDRVPTEAEIREWQALQPFIVQPVSIVGVYQNIDIDSIVFHYKSKVTDKSEFWQQLRREARSAGWTETQDVTGAVAGREYEVFQRLKPKGELWFSSAEELRVGYASDRIVVAYVQSDQDGAPKFVSQVSEGRFAEEHIWPRFIRLVSPGSANRRLQPTSGAGETSSIETWSVPLVACPP